MWLDVMGSGLGTQCFGTIRGIEPKRCWEEVGATTVGAMLPMIGMPQGAEVLIVLAIGLGCLAPFGLLVWLIVKLAHRT